MQETEERTLQVTGTHGRDSGKVFHIVEIDPLTLSGYVFRLIAALRVESYDALQRVMAEDGIPLDAVMHVLKGADPDAVHKLLTELMAYVQISPDPKHPGVKRPMEPDDVRELRTLGDILGGILRLNFGEY